MISRCSVSSQERVDEESTFFAVCRLTRLQHPRTPSAITDTFALSNAFFPLCRGWSSQTELTTVKTAVGFFYVFPLRFHLTASQRTAGTVSLICFHQK
jgi:hypothetical protein